MSFRRSVVAAAVASLTGCASLFTGTTDPLRFDANVPGVMLSIDGRFVGTLPLSLTQSRNFMGGQQFIAKFEAPGYETQEFRLERQFNTVAILDVSSPVTSGGIDVLTGSLMRFSPTDHHVIMRPLAAAPQPNAPAPAYPPGAAPPAMSPPYPPPAAPAPAPGAVPPPPGGSSGIDRSLRLHQFAAANFRRIQADVARGGGEHLSAAAGLAGGGDASAARRCEEAALRAASSLVSVGSPAEFARRFEAILAAAPSPQ